MDLKSKSNEKEYIADLPFRIGIDPENLRKCIFIPRGTLVQTGIGYIKVDNREYTVQSTLNLIRDKWLIDPNTYQPDKVIRHPNEKGVAYILDPKKQVMNTVELPIDYDRPIESVTVLAPVSAAAAAAEANKMTLDKWVDLSNADKLAYISGETPELSFMTKAVKVEKGKMKKALLDRISA